MSTTFEDLGYLGGGYQKKLIYNIVYDTRFAKRALPKLQASYFGDFNIKLLFTVVKNYYETHGLVPNLDNVQQSVLLEVREPAQQALLVALIRDLVNLRKQVDAGDVQNDNKFIQETALKFIRQQIVQRVINEADVLLRSGNLDAAQEIPEMFRDALAVTQDADMGRNIFEFNDAMLENQHLDAIPTGIKEIDQIIGGLPKGKLGMILAGQGQGKTRILTYLANNAFLQGKNVLHVIFDENSVDEIHKLHFVKWSGVEVEQFPLHKQYVLGKIKEVREKHTVGSLTIKRFSSDGTTMPLIRNWAKAYQEMHGLTFDMIVLDYIDEVESAKGITEKYATEAEVVKSFHSMLVDFDIPGWTATQGKKESNDKRLLVFDDCGGSVAKLKKSQLVISIGADLEQKRTNKANFSIIKSNFSSSGQIFENSDYHRGKMTISLNSPSGFIPENILRQGDDEEAGDQIIVGKYNPSNLPPSAFDDELPTPAPVARPSLQPEAPKPAPAAPMAKKTFTAPPPLLDFLASDELDAACST